MKILGWKPKTNFKTLVQMMTDADLKLALNEATFIGEKNSQNDERALSRSNTP